MRNEFLKMRDDNSISGLLDLINFINSNSDIKTKDMRMIEIGSYTGESTRIFAKNFKEVLAIDPFIDNYDINDDACHFMPFDIVYEEFKKNMSEFPNVSHIRKTSDEAIIDIKTQYDFVYIDGMHTYEAVKSDILNYKKITNGFIGGHDFQQLFIGVIIAVDETLGLNNISTFSDTSWIYKIKN